MTELNAAQKATLIRIETTAGQLRNYVEETAVTARKALEMMDKGQMLNSFGFGPIGHQLPFDLATTTTKLQGLVDMAFALELTQEQISEAYENGSIGMTARFERDRKADRS